VRYPIEQTGEYVPANLPSGNVLGRSGSGSGRSWFVWRRNDTVAFGGFRRFRVAACGDARGAAHGAARERGIWWMFRTPLFAFDNVTRNGRNGSKGEGGDEKDANHRKKDNS
jgi:hypothetical protein